MTHWLDTYSNGVGATVAPSADAGYVTDLYNGLVQIGFPAGTLGTTYAMAYILCMSNWFKDAPDQNYTGIKWINYENSAKGRKYGSIYLAKFPYFSSFAKYLLKVLNIDMGTGKPIAAPTAQDFINRLKGNKFIGRPVSVTGFNAALKRVTAALAYIAKKKQQQQQEQQHTTDILDNVYAHATRIFKLLQDTGLAKLPASYGTYAAYHETNAFSSPLYLQHNNASGIMYAAQKGATKGANGYAYFATLRDWANAYKHELTKKANPAGAKTIEDFARRLKTNGYYQDTYDNYLTGLKRARLVLKIMPDADKAVGPAEKEKLKMPVWGWFALGAAGLLVLRGATR